jgi:4-cresol dehydrogenase (hydroxylating)
MKKQMLSDELIKKWIDLLGKQQVLTDEKELLLYNLSSLGLKSKVCCVLVPANVRGLSACLTLANEHSIPVHPISCGKNYGYGSLSSYQGESVVIDLKRLNHISECNAQYGYVIVEPGVTFRQVYQHIAEHAPNYKLSSFGGSSQASMIGNALERGLGKGITGNREVSSEAMEIVLADGSIVSLKDNLNFPDKTAIFQHSTIGINLSPLLFQSNLAVVSKMIIWLEPIPEYMHLITFAVERENQLKSLLIILQELIQKNLIIPVYSFYNDIRLMVGSGKRLDDYPQTSFVKIKKNILAELKENYGREISVWNSSFCVASSCLEEGELKAKLIEEKLKKITSFITVDVIDKKTAKKFIKKSANDDYKVKESDFRFLFNLGYTNEYDQQSLYWRMPRSTKRSDNPVQDGCGLIWFAPKIPFDANQISFFYKELKKIATQFNRELPVTFQVKSPHLICGIIPILFNQQDQQSTKDAYQFYYALLEMSCEKGYLPYRLPNISMEVLFSGDNPYFDLLKKIKNAFDTKGIISPGRYSSLY